MIERQRPSVWTAAAATWSILFALPSLYWATGAEAGSGTVAAAPEAALGAGAEPPALLTIGLAKLVFGGVLLWLPRSRFRTDRRVRIAAWAIAVALVLYGAAILVDHVLMLTGVRGIPVAIGESAVRWHALLWDPYWILGGVLLAMAVRGWGETHRDALDSREGVSAGGAEG